MALISVNNLTFNYENHVENIFEDASFRFDTDWKLGFIARNGRGKTTFLQLLMGKYEYSGSILANVAFDYFPFTVQDVSQNTWDVLEGICPELELWRVCRELSLLRLSEEVLYRPYETLSSGEQTTVGLAALFSMDQHFLLLDEPTKHLDRPARELLRDYLKTKKGFLLVSHDRDLLDACIDHVLAINKTNIEVCQGNFSTWQENKDRQDAYETAENDRLKKDIARLRESAMKTARWAEAVESTKIGAGAAKAEGNKDHRAYVGEKSRRMSQRRKNLERRQQREIEEKEGLLKNIETADALKLFPQRHYKQVIVRAEEVRIRYGTKTLPPVSFTLENGDRIVLRGKNGCGKSSMIKLLLQESGRSSDSALLPQENEKSSGNALAFEGRLELASGLKISYVPQDTGFLQGTIREFASKKGIDETLLLAMLRKLDLSREQFEKRLEDYSGGQKKKVLLAASLCEQAHLYIWDEPLNYIDVFSRIQLENLILQYAPTMLFVEHDKAFVDKVATKAVELQ